MLAQLRCVLAIVAGGAFGVLVAEILLGLGARDGGLCIAVMATCVLLRYLIKAVQEDRDATRIGREQVWLRRDREEAFRRQMAAGVRELDWARPRNERNQR